MQSFVRERAETGATLYTYEAVGYKGLASTHHHESVNHSVAEYVRDQAHTNGMEPFWSMRKRAHYGTFHKISAKHLNRYVQEFAGKIGDDWAAAYGEHPVQSFTGPGQSGQSHPAPA